MPYKELEIKKIYWTIGEAAEEIGIETSAIRFYDAELGLKIGRHSRKQLRMLRRRDVDRLKLIVRLTSYMHLAGIKKLIEDKRLEQIAEILK